MMYHIIKLSIGLVYRSTALLLVQIWRSSSFGWVWVGAFRRRAPQTSGSGGPYTTDARGYFMTLQHSKAITTSHLNIDDQSRRHPLNLSLTLLYQNLSYNAIQPITTHQSNEPSRSLPKFPYRLRYSPLFPSPVPEPTARSVWNGRCHHTSVISLLDTTSVRAAAAVPPHTTPFHCSYAGPLNSHTY